MRHFLVLVLTVGTVSVSAAAPRTWTSRSGGFSVEAELVDVRDGNAVLKKADGTEVSVPLSKLSLIDVRFIKEELQSTEKAIEAAPEPGPAPAGTMPTAAEPAPASAKPVPAKRSPVSASAIRYGWKPDQTYWYRLSVEARFGDVTEKINGNVHYTVKTVGPDGVVELACDASLRRSRGNATAGVPSTVRFSAPPYRYPFRSPAPPYYRPYRSSSPPAESDRVKIDRFGRILSVEGGERLPYLLGKAAHLPLERLSQLDEKRWTITGDTGVALSREDWLPDSAWPGSRQEQLPATEKTTYTVIGSDSKGIHLAKTCEMATVASVDGKPRVALSGEGQLTFDTEAGVFSSSKMKMRLAVRNTGIAVEVTTTVSYELVTEAERAKLKADGEKAMEAARERTRERERPIGEEDVDTLLKDLASDDFTKRLNATMRLTSKRPQEPNRKLAAGLESLLKSDTPRVRQSAANALQYWATPESIPVLLKLLDDPDRSVRGHAVQALGRLKATSAIDRLVQMWPNEFHVGEALKAMGPAAEPAVLRVLGGGNERLRNESLQLLQQIGTRKSIPALEKILKQSDRTAKIFAQSALDAIKSRQ